MADELRTSLNRFQFVKGGVDVALPPILVNFDIGGDEYVRKTQLIADTDTLVDMGDVSTPGYLFAMNLDPVNHIDIGIDGSTYPIRLRENFGWAVFYVNGAAIHAIAITDPSLMEYMLVSF